MNKVENIVKVPLVIFNVLSVLFVHLLNCFSNSELTPKVLSPNSTNAIQKRERERIYALEIFGAIN